MPESKTTNVLPINDNRTRMIRMQKRYDELMREGKQGHYESMFKVWNEEFERIEDQHEEELIKEFDAGIEAGKHTGVP